VAAIWVILALRSNHSPQKTVRVSVRIVESWNDFTVGANCWDLLIIII